jgi:hypothetical protein
MNNNPICIDVRGMSVEEKKHVQDLLFSLDYEWQDFFDGKQYKYFDEYVNFYTNIYGSSDIYPHLLWSNSLGKRDKQYLVTLEQLEKRVEEKQAMDYTLEFDIIDGRSSVEYQKIDFTKEDFFDLKGDLLSGNLSYKEEDTRSIIKSLNDLMVLCMNDNVYRKVVLSKEDIFKKTLIDIMNKVYDDNKESCSEKNLIDAIWESNLFELK